MRIGIIGRTEILYKTALSLCEAGHQIAFIITAKEAPEYTVTANDFKLLAEKLNVPFVQSPKISDLMQFLVENKSDIAVSINYSGILPQEIIDLFPLGVLNAHGGDLPRYRGNACQAWAILNGEKRIGLCIHKMIGGELDSGDIIARDYYKIDIETKITQVWEWMLTVTPLLMKEAVSNLAKDPSYVLDIQSKNASDALRCYPRRPEDGRIKWSAAAIDILRLVNASNKPDSGAFCEYKGNSLVIWDAELVSGFENFCAIPGQVILIGEGFIEVACGEGKLRILSAEYAGQVDKPDKWIKSIRIRLN